MKTYYITTPIYYVNDKPHIGHAYTSLACDVIARFKRLDGFQVHFLTGTDEHGQKVAQAAEKKGISPQAFTDDLSANFWNLTQSMNFSHNDFIRTTQERHKKSARAFWKRLEQRGYIYQGTYEGWYAIRDEAFYMESELVKDDEGNRYAPSGAKVEWLKEKSFFFKLSDFQSKLLDFYQTNPDFILPLSRANEVKSFVKSGLQDLSISRMSFSWGIPVPDAENHIIYVWVEALVNYISALGWPDGKDFSHFWPADLHMVGKDIVRFHAVYWPAMLMAADLALPKRVYAHGWWTNEGQKISKSVGNVIDPLQLIDQYGLDQMRYFLLREVPFGRDGNFSVKAIIQRSNNDLANDFGNLCQRTLTLIKRYCESNIPAISEENFSNEDKALYNSFTSLPEEVRSKIDRQEFHQALIKIADVVAVANRYITKAEPWRLAKTDRPEMEKCLTLLYNSLRHCAICSQAFMPLSMDKMLDQLGVDKNQRQLKNLELALLAETKIQEPEAIFARYQEDD